MCFLTSVILGGGYQNAYERLSKLYCPWMASISHVIFYYLVSTFKNKKRSGTLKVETSSCENQLSQLSAVSTSKAKHKLPQTQNHPGISWKANHQRLRKKSQGHDFGSRHPCLHPCRPVSRPYPWLICTWSAIQHKANFHFTFLVELRIRGSI